MTNRTTDTATNPLLGHAISHGGTVIGLFAVVLWGFMAGLMRLAADAFEIGRAHV